MALFDRKDKKLAAIKKEHIALLKKEAHFKQKARKAEQPRWKAELEKKVPEKAYQSLEAAFRKAFSVVFTKGTGVIEKAYKRKELEESYSIQDYAVQVKGGRRELKQVKRYAKRTGMANSALTAVEGLGLGILGIGLPDIVLFIGMLLKGIYQTAVSYGFTYEGVGEQVFILRLMDTALARGAEFEEKDSQIDAMIAGTVSASEEELQEQLQKTSSAFAVDMLLLKFVQGFPLIGILGGAANPVYFNKIMNYVQLKYHKRYLMAAAQRNGWTL